MQYLIAGNDQFGRVNLGRDTAAAALKKARELVQEGYLDVRICTPRGAVLLSDEFDQLEPDWSPASPQESSPQE